MIFRAEYHSVVLPRLNSVNHPDGRVINYYKNKTEVVLQNGARKEQFNDGYSVIYFENGDIKQTYTDGRSVYYYCEAKVT